MTLGRLSAGAAAVFGWALVVLPLLPAPAMEVAALKFTVDRIEGDRAVLLLRGDERQQLVVPLADLPAGARESSILRAELSLDPGEEDAARERVKKLLGRLVEKGRDA